jgi:hypothetical protein
MGEWRREQRDTFGAGDLDCVDYLDFRDKLGLLTANATTPYSMAFPNLEKTGPLVIEVPAGLFVGGILDFWQRPLTDIGALGPDKQKGGKYLILGPDHPDMKADGYFVFRSQTWNLWMGVRGLDEDRTRAAELLGKFRIYPYDKRDNPPASKHIRPDGRKWTGEQPRGLGYWECLSRLINEEPTNERDRMIVAMLQPLGIEKGKPFNPDARQKAILIEGANMGELMSRAMGYAKRFTNARVWPSSKWETSLNLAETNRELPNYTQVDERAWWFYEAVGATVGMMGRLVGAGQLYLETMRDSTGAWLDGGKNYTLHVPKDPPVAQFWSLAVYDNESRCLIDTGGYPDRSSRDDIVKNADGTWDLYAGPTAPEGKPPQNWIKTLPNKGWFPLFRFYAPTKAYFDRSWVLPDIEPVN